MRNSVGLKAEVPDETDFVSANGKGFSNLRATSG
jgi:hypothetical protein